MTTTTGNANASKRQKIPSCLSRRDFLLSGSAATVVLAVGCAGVRLPAGSRLRIVDYPHKRIARLADVKPHSPMFFNYPDSGYAFSSFLVRLDGPASGGVGPEDSIVAFNGTCTHMGGPVGGQYNAEHALAGPCPLHLTTYDLRRHGMVAAGHGTETLPQIRLEVVDGEIFATGVMGLIYGLDRNFVRERYESKISQGSI